MVLILYLKKAFLLFDTTLMKCFLYSREGIPGATIPAAPTKNLVKVISIHSIRNLSTT